MTQVYTLQTPRVNEVTDELYYVGRTTNIVERFSKHQNGTGAKCLHGRSNISMVRLEKETPFLELVRTLELMRIHGPSKVRGGPFVKGFHNEDDLKTIQVLLECENFRREEDVPAKFAIGITTPKSDDTFFAKKGTKWTPSDLQNLKELIKSHSSMENAIKVLQRSPGTIESRAQDLLVQAHNKGHAVESIASELHVLPEKLQTILNGSAKFFE